MSWENARAYVKEQIDACAGIRPTSGRIADQVNALPSALVYISGVRSMRESAAFKKAFISITTMAFVSRADIGRAVETIQPILEEFIARLEADRTLGGTVSHINGDIDGSVGVYDYGGVQTWGFQVQFEAKITGS